MPEEPQKGKRVSWVELYFDLIFVFAVGQTARIMEADPHRGSPAIALGLFIPLWWTWIGFVVLYNRHGEDKAAERLLVLAGTLPCAVAAIETHAAAHGQGMAFTFALAGARLVLAAAFALSDRARSVAIGYVVSTAAFAGSAFLPGPWRYYLWAFALIQEAGFLLLRDGERGRGRDREHRDAERPPRPSRTESLRGRFKPPSDPARRVDAGHLAERFGLMMIILLGELVVAVAASAVEVTGHDLWYWLGLLGGLVLAAALWWIYFTAAAPLSEAVLRASGGNPSMAYGLYAGGHLGPAFALLTMAAGVSLALSGEAPPAAAWLITAGLAIYVVGNRAVVTDQFPRFGRLAQAGVIVVTVCLAFLKPLISTTGVVLVTAAWAVAIAAHASWRTPGRLKGIAANPLAYFHAPAPAPKRN